MGGPKSEEWCGGLESQALETPAACGGPVWADAGTCLPDSGLPRAQPGSAWTGMPSGCRTGGKPRLCPNTTGKVPTHRIPLLFQPSVPAAFPRSPLLCALLTLLVTHLQPVVCAHTGLLSRERPGSLTLGATYSCRQFPGVCCPRLRAALTGHMPGVAGSFVWFLLCAVLCACVVLLNVPYGPSGQV